MSQVTVEQLQDQVKDLKSRILDTQDAFQQKAESEKELAGALTEIVKIVGLQSETGQIALVDVVRAVQELVEKTTVSDVEQSPEAGE